MVEVPNDQFEELVRKSTEYDKFVAGGYNSVDDANAKVDSLNNDLNNCNKSREELEKQLEDCQENPSMPEVPPGWSPNGYESTVFSDGKTSVTTNYKKD